MDSFILKAAGIYNILWGTLVILFPYFFFDLAHMERPNYPELWQCVGMIVGVYGIGYWIAANDPIRHYPIILVGFLGKILGPIGFVQALWSGKFTGIFGINIIFNDLIWWIPFYWILKKKWVKDKTFFS